MSGSTTVPSYANPSTADKNDTFPFDVSSLTNFHQVDSGVFRGAKPSSKGLRELSDAKFKSVVALDGLDSETPILGPFVRLIEGESPGNTIEEGKAVVAIGMKFFDCALNSMESVSTAEDGIIRRALSVAVDTKNQPVYIHCTHGEDRTGLVAALYRVLFQGWTCADAMVEWNKLGHGGIIHTIMSGRLNSYFDRVSPEMARRYAENPNGIREEVIKAGTA